MSNSLIRRFSTLLLALAGASGLMAPIVAHAQEAKPETKADDTKDANGKKKDPDLAISINPDDPAAKKIYVVQIRGELGNSFSANGLRNVLKDAKIVQPDIIVLRIDAEFSGQRGQAGNLNDPRDNMMAFDGGYDTAAAMGIMLIDEIKNDPTWKVKPRLVAWVKRAVGQTAFIPYFCPEVYFTSDGMQGGIGYLDFMFRGRGDVVVQEKQQSLRLGRAEGLAIKGGHDPKLVRAMTRRDYSLSYTLVGGKPVYYENITDGENILTDDGDPEAGRADTMEEAAAYRGNDVLNLTAPLAKTIGYSDGTADTLEALSYELGISRAYRVYTTKPAQILREYSQLVSRQSAQYEKLEADFRAEYPRREQGATVNERNQRRNKCKRYLDEMITIIERFPEMTHGKMDAEGQIAQYKQLKVQIDQEIRLDRDQPKGR